MRILYLQTFPFWGSGSGTYARHLASEIGRRHKVAILAPDDRPIERAKLYPVSLPFPVAFTGHPEWPDCKLYTELSSEEILAIRETLTRATIKAVEEFKPDIIHVHHAFPFSWAAGFVKDTHKINFIVTIHGSELPTLEKDKRYYQRTYDAMYRAKRIIPNSGWTRDWFLRIFKGYFHEKCRVIPGGVNIDKFVYSEAGAKAVDNQLGLHGKPVVLFAGKLTKYKGVEYLVGAAKKIHGEVIIMGDGPESGRLKEKARLLGATNIHWVGHLGAGIKKLVPYYSRADVFVAPSTWDEPLGLVILESMACSTPVVVTRKGGIPLAVKEGYNGYFVRPRNSSEIVEKVNKLLDNESIRIKMGENARKSVEQKFSWETIGRKFEYRPVGALPACHPSLS
ncbi:MAG: Glycosyl transferase group 1 [Candidatus Gottesmanbacteria bacterium GW2011_GWA2_47_9]|uniref:Glycosyl transferase group 1 n=1 Tax=Candidatus Gottesmanbacteria bacterium GW2011_GWA2_47_9 TaxID=1618445 RepID=A0A0G1U0P4_9BACT|nr:MAG: Glycosyl transferase group 1 [Candidatus Gottesmanbacteria bacterium GW2011_GWA2_47_9]